MDEYNYCEFCRNPLNLYNRRSILICDDCMKKIQTLLLEYDLFQHIVRHYDTLFKMIDEYENERKSK